MKRLILCVMILCVGVGLAMASERSSSQAVFVDATAQHFAADVCEVTRSYDAALALDPTIGDRFAAVDSLDLVIDCGGGGGTEACCVHFDDGSFCCVSCDRQFGCDMLCGSGKRFP
jgi:hypothetical protein